METQQVSKIKKFTPVLALLLSAQQAAATFAAAPIPHDNEVFILSKPQMLTVPLNGIFDPTVYNGADAVTTAAAFGSNTLIATGVMAMFGSGLFLLGLRTLMRARPR